MIRAIMAGVILSGCSVKNSPVEAPTKYPGTPTMQSAEDATKGVL